VAGCALAHAEPLLRLLLFCQAAFHAVPVLVRRAGSLPSAPRHGLVEDEPNAGQTEQEEGQDVQAEVLVQGEVIDGWAKVGCPVVTQDVLQPVHRPVESMHRSVQVQSRDELGRSSVAAREDDKESSF